MKRTLSIILLPVLLFSLALPLDMAAKKNTSKNKAKTTSVASSKKSSKKRTSSRSKKSSSKPETSADMRRRQADTQREIARTKEEIRKNEADVKRGLNELGKLRDDISAGKKLVDQATAQVNALDSRIDTLGNMIASNEAQLVKLRQDYLKAVKKIRGKRNSNSTLAFIFSSKNFAQAMRRIRYIRQFSAWRQKQSDRIAAKVSELKSQKQKLDEARQMKDVALSRQVKAQNDLQTRFQRQDALVVELKANGRALQSHLAKKQAEANDLKNRISALIAEEQRKAEAERKAREAEERRRAEEAKKAEDARLEAQAKREAEAKAAAEKVGKSDKKKENKKNQDKKKEDKKRKEDKKKTDKKNSGYAEARKRRPRSAASGNSAPAVSASAATSSAAGNFASMRGSLPRPVAGGFRVTSQFGRHALPELPDVMYDNPGIDAEVALGASAQAVYGGKVSGVYVIPGYSTVVIVNHGSYYTVYGNISSPAVKVGDVVKQGQSLGRLAQAEEDSSHSSIHFEVWKNREKLNPLDWIR